MFFMYLNLFSSAGKLCEESRCEDRHGGAVSWPKLRESGSNLIPSMEDSASPPQHKANIKLLGLHLKPHQTGRDRNPR